MGRKTCVAVLAVVVLSCCAAGPAWAQSPISSLQREVAAALARELRANVDEGASGLRILAPPGMSLLAHAKLHVISVHPGFSPGSWLVRMDCSARIDCLPFHVVLNSAALEASDLAGCRPEESPPSGPCQDPEKVAAQVSAATGT